MGRGGDGLCDTVGGRARRGRGKEGGIDGVVGKSGGRGMDTGSGEAVARMRWGAAPGESGWADAGWGSGEVWRRSAHCRSEGAGREESSKG